jgi:heme-binding protein
MVVLPDGSWPAWDAARHSVGAYGHGRINQAMGEPAWDSPTTRALAKQACFDCHSNKTEWPAYSSVAAASWLVQHEGRAVLNFSEWQRPQDKAGRGTEELRDGEMPPAAYGLMHAHARLGTEDRDRLARGWARTLGSTPQQAADEREP